MKTKSIFILVVALFASVPLVAQKAYDVVDYTAEFKDMTITFKYANGYVDASEIEILQEAVSPDREYDDYPKEGMITQKYNVKDGYILIYLDRSSVNSGKEIETIEGDYFYNNNNYSLVFKKAKRNVSYQEADKELNNVYQQLLKKYEKAPVFLKKLKAAQRLWIQFRDAELEMRYPLENKKLAYGNAYYECTEQFLIDMTIQRTNTLKEWLSPEEYDVCNGSKGILEEVEYEY